MAVFAPVSQTQRQEAQAEFRNSEAPIVIGDRLYPPIARENPELAIKAIEENKEIGYKYKPLKMRQELMMHHLIDAFMPTDKPDKIITFIDRLQVVRPDLAVKLIERLLPPQETPKQLQTGPIQQQAAPLIVVQGQLSKESLERLTPTPKISQDSEENSVDGVIVR
jgi:hypothetical protein